MIAIALAVSLPSFPSHGFTQSADTDETETVIEIQGRNSRQFIIHYLDSYLCLSSEQANLLDELLEHTWSSDINTDVWLMSHNGFRTGNGGGMITELDKDKLGSFLSEGQLDVINNLGSKSLILMDQLDKPSPDEDPIKAMLARTIPLELDRLEGEMELTEKQKMTLRIAAKGAAEKVLSDRKGMRDEHGRGIGSQMADPEVSRMLMEGPAFQLSRTEIWKKTINKTLTDEQLQVYKADQRLRLQRSAECNANGLAFNYHNTGLDLDANEYKEFSACITKAIMDYADENSLGDDRSLYFQGFMIYVELEEDPFADVLSGEKLEMAKKKRASFGN
jgi:hypothetical protein